MQKYIGWLIGAIAIVVISIVFSYNSSNLDIGQLSSEKSEIRLGCEKSLLTAPVWIAEDKGYFEKNGLRVNIKAFDSGKASLTSLITEGNLDICTVAQTPIMFNSFNKSNFKIISSMVTSTEDVKVIGNSDAGIKYAKDLKGKRIGLTKGSTGEYYFSLVLLNLNLNTSDVEIVNFKPSALPNALNKLDVDAICIWEPHALKTKKLLRGKSIVVDVGELYREDFYFVATDKFLETNHDASKRFLESINDAQKFISEHENEAKKIVSKRLGINYEDIDSLWSEFNYQLMLDQTILLTLEDEARWAIKNGLTDKKEVPNYLNYIHTDSLEQVGKIKMQIFK